MDCIVRRLDSSAPWLSLRPATPNSSEGTTVLDIFGNYTGLPKVHWSFPVPCNLPGGLEPWNPTVWGSWIGELKGLDLLKLGAEPGVLGGLKDTGGLNSLFKFFHVMGDFGPFKMGTEYFIVPGRS